MKKVIALALTLAMVLAMGVTAFAADGSFATFTFDDETFVVDVKEVVEIKGITDDMKVTIADVNGFMTFGAIQKVKGTDYYVVEVTGTKVGVTRIVLTDKNGNKCYSDFITINTPTVKDPASNRNVNNWVADVASQGFQSTITIDLREYYLVNVDTGLVDADGLPISEVQKYYTGKYYEGISAAVYNAATKLHPEEIVIVGEDFELTLYRGDYVTTKIAKDIIIDVAVSDRVYNDEGKDLNNNVLAALGNNKADPFYVTVESINLDAVADKPELNVCLHIGFDYAQWTKTNNSKAMAMYKFDAEDDSIEVIAKSIKVNNSFDNILTMPTIASGVYAFVDATNAATSSANVKDNVSTGANDMMAVAVVFATIALAAGVSKKVR